MTIPLGRRRLQIVPSTTGNDRWLLVDRNTIVWAWSAPKWMSFMRGDGRLRGGC